MNLPVQQVLFLQLPGTLRKLKIHSVVILKPLPSFDPTSYQLRKSLSHLLHMKELGARDVDRWNRECLALLLQIWRKELELTPLKTTAVTRTTKSPSKGSSGTKSTRHLVLKQIYGNCPLGTLQLTPPECSNSIEMGFNYNGQTSIQIGTFLFYSQAPREFLAPPFNASPPAILGQNWFHDAFWHLNPERLPAKRSSASLHY